MEPTGRSENSQLPANCKRRKGHQQQVSRIDNSRSETASNKPDAVSGRYSFSSGCISGRFTDHLARPWASACSTTSTSPTLALLRSTQGGPDPNHTAVTTT
jgi:hypothetical protein